MERLSISPEKALPLRGPNFIQGLAGNKGKFLFFPSTFISFVFLGRDFLSLVYILIIQLEEFLFGIWSPKFQSN